MKISHLFVFRRGGDFGELSRAVNPLPYTGTLFLVVMEKAAALVRRLGLEEGPVKEAFLASVTWANQFETMDLEGTK